MTSPRLRTSSRLLRFLTFRRVLGVVLPGFLLFALCFGPVWDQVAAEDKRDKPKPYALVFGTVWAPDNRPLYGVKVKIRRADQKKAHWELYSDHNGEFAQRLPAGRADYFVRADLKGYKFPDGKQLHAGEEVKVHIERDERVDIGLHLK
ncbi:MAG TPA: hypothetical protein VGV15_21950 [Terriglobales bacterium]|nr:hypothetical protein [Terriglobales bacterium]